MELKKYAYTAIFCLDLREIMQLILSRTDYHYLFFAYIFL
jgi:hypothetical protein